MPDSKTRVLGYTRALGKGGVAYIALGHCHSPRNDMQPFVDTSVNPSGTTPMLFRGSWETESFAKLLSNGSNGVSTRTLGCSRRPHSARLKASGIRRRSSLAWGHSFFGR